MLPDRSLLIGQKLLKNAKIFLPDHDDKVEELGYTHTRHEPGCGVVAKHDRDQNEGPNEESHREGNPE